MLPDTGKDNCPRSAKRATPQVVPARRSTATTRRPRAVLTFVCAGSRDVVLTAAVISLIGWMIALAAQYVHESADANPTDLVSFEGQLAEFSRIVEKQIERQIVRKL